MNTKIVVPLNVVYYQKIDNELGKKVINLKGRVAKKRAEEYFKEEGIQYDTIFKVVKEDIEIEINEDNLNII